MYILKITRINQLLVSQKQCIYPLAFLLAEESISQPVLNRFGQRFTGVPPKEGQASRSSTAAFTWVYSSEHHRSGWDFRLRLSLTLVMTTHSNMQTESEVTEYLKSPDMEILNRFPRIIRVFMRHNCPTPSSAPVERLFMLGNIVLQIKRNRLTDKRFEELLLLRYNRFVGRPSEE